MSVLSAEHETATNLEKKKKEMLAQFPLTCQLKKDLLQYYAEVYLTTWTFGSWAVG